MRITRQQIQVTASQSGDEHVGTAVHVKVTRRYPIRRYWNRKRVSVWIEGLIDISALRFVRLSIRTVGIDGISIPAMQRE